MLDTDKVKEIRINHILHLLEGDHKCGELCEYLDMPFREYFSKNNKDDKKETVGEMH